MKSERVVLASRPVGRPEPANFAHERVELAGPGEGEVLLRVLYCSVDPYMRMKMDDRPSYTPPYALGEVMGGRGVGEVLESRDERWQPGDLVVGPTGWQSHALARGDELRSVASDLPLPAALGVLGMPGFTAYAGLNELGRPRPGETLVVAAAAGPVGGTVAQLARLHGMHVVAITGGDHKVAHVRGALGVPTVLDRNAPDLAAQLESWCPDGVDVYFENVGGPVTDAVLPLLNDFARVPVCGLVSRYNEAADAAPGPDRLAAFMRLVLTKSLSVRGFIAREFVDGHYDEFERRMRGWVRDGRLRHHETVVDGLGRAPELLADLLVGRHVGKAVVRVA